MSIESLNIFLNLPSTGILGILTLHPTLTLFSPLLQDSFGSLYSYRIFSYIISNAFWSILVYHVISSLTLSSLTGTLYILTTSRVFDKFSCAFNYLPILTAPHTVKLSSKVRPLPISVITSFFFTLLCLAHSSSILTYFSRSFFCVCEEARA